MHVRQDVAADPHFEHKAQVPVDEIWTAQNVATYWRVSDRMVTAMAVRGEIPGAFKVGSYWRFRSEAIRKMEHKQT